MPRRIKAPNKADTENLVNNTPAPDASMVDHTDGASVVFDPETCERLLDSFCARWNFDDLRKATQLQFQAALMYVNKHYISIYKKDLLEEDNTGTGIVYSLNKLDKIYEWFISCASMLDKAATVTAFLYLVGIDYYTFYRWLNEVSYSSVSGVEVTHRRLEFAQKISKTEEESLISINITGKRNPVGIIELLNHRFGHSASIRKGEAEAVTASAAVSLPRFDGNGAAALSATGGQDSGTTGGA